MSTADDGRANIKRIAMLCREAEELLTTGSPRRVQILLQMLRIELDKYPERAAAATPIDRPSVVASD